MQKKLSDFFQSKNLADLRISLFILWICFALILLVLSCSILYRPKFADTNIVLSTAKHLSGLWLPSLSCFAAVWFASNHDPKIQHDPLAYGQRIGAFGFTFLYFFICLLFVILTLFGPYEYDPISMEPIGGTLEQRIVEVVSWIQLLSPVLLAPIGILTGRLPVSAEPPLSIPVED